MHGANSLGFQVTYPADGRWNSRSAGVKLLRGRGRGVGLGFARPSGYGRCYYRNHGMRASLSSPSSSLASHKRATRRISDKFGANLCLLYDLWVLRLDHEMHCTDEHEHLLSGSGHVISSRYLT